MLIVKHAIAVAGCFLMVGSLCAEPSRIILLRHGEKENAYALCDVGQKRSLALKAQYLGKNAEKSLFDKSAPEAFFATTLHSLELASPAADSWGLPVITYAVVPLAEIDAVEVSNWVTNQTRRAATELMNNPRWHQKTVVMVWEHKHIANEKMVENNPDLMVDLRQLLKLDQLPAEYQVKVPKTWSGANYNYFWIVDYDTSGKPVAFAQQRQDFSGKYSGLPNNDWGVAEVLAAKSKCKRWR